MHNRACYGRWVRQGNTITLFGMNGSGVSMELALETTYHPTLRRGSTGSAVQDLQTRLLSAGFNPGPVDGIFGYGTEGAVKSFQSSRGLTVDGIVGPQTWGALDSAPGTSRPTVPPVSSTPVGGAGLSLQHILAAMTRKRYIIYTEPYRLNIVGVRNMSGEPNRFDDSINVFYKDSAGKWVHKENPGTTDPGVYYLLNPMNVSGTAIVVPGQYADSHQLGLHRGQYTALVQKGPVTIVRDPNKDDRLDFTTGTPVSGVYGINIHRATSSGASTVVNKYSAGCQVFANSSDFAQFIEWAKRHSQMYGNSFTYTLLEETDL
jgi:peptidoglycan hydrolase-like protein with peptidoglycan-binding domain